MFCRFPGSSHEMFLVAGASIVDCDVLAQMLTYEIGAKAKEKEEDQKRETQNRERASSAYTPPEQLDDRSDLSGLPWGGLSLAYMAQSSKAKESTSQAETSGETTTAATSSEKP